MDIFTIENKTEEKFLRQKTTLFDFTKFSRAQITDLLKNMRRAMHDAHGIGLAANQVGLPYRMFIAQIEGKSYTVFNPTITKYSNEHDALEEGCLSVPKTFGTMERSTRIELRGYDRYSKSIKFKVRGLLARVFQHEVDHLDGRLFTDHARDVHHIDETNHAATTHNI